MSVNLNMNVNMNERVSECMSVRVKDRVREIDYRDRDDCEVLAVKRNAEERSPTLSIALSYSSEGRWV